MAANRQQTQIQFPERLPVVVKKGRHELQDLTGTTPVSTWLCPHGKLTASIDGMGSIKVHDLCTPSVQCTVSSHRYSR